MQRLTWKSTLFGITERTNDDNAKTNASHKVFSKCVQGQAKHFFLWEAVNRELNVLHYASPITVFDEK